MTSPHVTRPVPLRRPRPRASLAARQSRPRLLHQVLFVVAFVRVGAGVPLDCLGLVARLLQLVLEVERLELLLEPEELLLTVIILALALVADVICDAGGTAAELVVRRSSCT